MNDFLNKPIERIHMMALIERWLNNVQHFGKPSDYTAPVLVASSPILDQKTLQRLADDLSADTMLRITQAFLDDSVNSMNILHDPNGTPDLIAIREAAHALKGSSSNCGLRQLSEFLSTLETAASLGDTEAVAPLLTQVTTVYIAARERLLAERERYQA